VGVIPSGFWGHKHELLGRNDVLDRRRK